MQPQYSPSNRRYPPGRWWRWTLLQSRTHSISMIFWRHARPHRARAINVNLDLPTRERQSLFGKLLAHACWSTVTGSRHTAPAQPPIGASVDRLFASLVTIDSTTRSQALQHAFPRAIRSALAHNVRSWHSYDNVHLITNTDIYSNMQHSSMYCAGVTYWSQQRTTCR